MNVIALHLPALRERPEDIPLLAEAFLKRIADARGQEVCVLSQDALDSITVFDWPGNVRELENALERAAILSRGTQIMPEALPESVTARKSDSLVDERPMDNPTLDVIEHSYIMWVLQAEGGNKTRTAEVLGIDPSTLYRKLARYQGDTE